jgi:two-component system response regulator YesN
MDQRIVKALHFIHRDLTSDLSLSKLAQRVHLSPCYFAHLFKLQMATPVEAYIRERRILKAQQLLRDTSMSIKEIAGSVGFSTPEYFSRVFSRYLGQSPTAFRKKVQEAGSLAP